ncbi:sigma-54-dependent transcriptional regulator [Tepidibacter aestuarii]|uniref:sigma-54-dependent transcriptional regulator n=1 Tax=Tepidibacter aestuarii TaxID=2925782 RepID=UPI0020BD473C|nr:sigma-54 dependent transcriptional regulator [Tepidibacter aestuarii]CAH2213435.1 Stage 0 sporulation protein A homolog [Tepidibacter aestuarii]
MKKSNNLPLKILIVDDEIEYRESIQMILDGQGYYIETSESAEEALEKLKKTNFNLVLTDLIMGETDGVQLLNKIKEKYNDIEVILITGYGTVENAVEAMKKGAFTYFVKGHNPEDLIKEIKKVEKMISSKNKKLISEKNSLESILTTNSKKFRKVLNIAKKAANSNVNILLLGESGVGKEVFAKYVHNCSERKNEKFIPVNCHAFSGGLLESELFGHEKGSFTGAVGKRKGRFEVADNGTLFLDEVGDVSLDIQVKLLRILETKKIERLGGNDLIPVNFRLISATNKKLEKEIGKGNFREDFFYRISTIAIEIPPLRERKEDLHMLIDFFFKKSKRELNKEILNIENGVMEFLLSYDYPGNIRELKNIIERLVVLSENGIISKRDLPKSKDVYIDDEVEIIKPLKDMRKEVESEYIAKVLEMCDDNVSEAARNLCISRRQLFNKITEYGLK